ncbi:hypothetical protein ACOME3_002447 [Neoechinorhynchus agilis]
MIDRYLSREDVLEEDIKRTSLVEEGQDLSPRRSRSSGTSPLLKKPKLSNPQCTRSPIFINTYFIISIASTVTSYTDMERQMTDNGGKVLKLKSGNEYLDRIKEIFDEILDKKDSNCPKSQSRYPVILIASEHNKTREYMLALSLGLPTISYRWIKECLKENRRTEWGRHLLPRGLLIETDTLLW